MRLFVISVCVSKITPFRIAVNLALGYISY